MAAGTLEDMLSRVPVEEITARARKAKPGHVLLTLFGALLFGAAWLIAKLFGVLFLAGAWCAIAVDEGWRSARGTARPGPNLAEISAENARLRDENSRLNLGVIPSQVATLQAEVDRLRQALALAQP